MVYIGTNTSLATFVVKAQIHHENVQLNSCDAAAVLNHRLLFVRSFCTFYCLDLITLNAERQW